MKSFLSYSLLFASLLGYGECARALVHPVRAPSKANNVIIQMFQWNWDSVSAECTNFIGPNGYGYVQISPPQEHIQGSQWWTDYQPVSYILTSKRGTRAQFQSMINTCHSAGVGVVVDTIWNHMAGISGGTGVAGSSFTQFNYPGIYQAQDFHYCGSPNNQINNYDNSTNVWTCELDNLADLATDTTYVRSRLAQYGNDLLSLGADGFRLDAAKHINPNDLVSIISQLSRKPYITQEVTWGAGEAVQPSMYTGNGDVMEFRYTGTLQSYFQSSGIANIPSTIANGGWVASNGANVFVADHDTERAGSLSYNSPSNIYTLAHVFMLAYPYGTPTVLSSYQFSGFDDGAPNGNTGTCSGTAGANGWLCQHRWPAIAGMVGFRNHVGSAAVTNQVSGTSQQLAFGRGALGFVAINNADSTWTATFTTQLPAGSYCDVVSGSKASNGACSGTAYAASGGSVSMSIAPRSAIGLHTGQMGSGSPGNGTGGGGGGTSSSVAVTFHCTATTVIGENIFVTGSIGQLSSWSTTNPIPLSSATYPVWSATINIPPSTNFQYKYIRIENGVVTWEFDPNRSFTTGTSGTVTINDSWNGPSA